MRRRRKLLVVRLCGGLGNQMFQYALYAKLKSLGKDVRLDKRHLERFEYRWGKTSIFDVFCLGTDDLLVDDKEKLSDFKQDVLSKARRRILGRKKTHYLERIEGVYDSSIFELQNAYLDGYWQTEKYFAQDRSLILQNYQFKMKLDSENQKVLEVIVNTENSVSIHVRMGDYNTDINQKIYGNICTPQYYEKAIKYFEDNLEKPTFFVFSNEPEKVNQLGIDGKYIIVDINKQQEMAWADMLLMSKCKYNIIANSTFSWWGAWLNTYPDKKVIAPHKWINNQAMPDICPREWIRI